MKTLERPVLETLQILDTREVAHELYEICATARAAYEDSSRELTVNLDAFVRRFEMRGQDQVLRPEWFPRPDCVRLQVSHEQAADAAKEIFHTWSRKVRKAIPGADEWNGAPAWLEAGRRAPFAPRTG